MPSHFHPEAGKPAYLVVIVILMFVGGLAHSASSTEERIQPYATAKLVPQVGHSSGVYAVGFSPDDRRVLTASGDGTAAIWDALSGRVIHRLAKHGEWLNSAAFNRAGDSIITA